MANGTRGTAGTTLSRVEILRNLAWPWPMVVAICACPHRSRHATHCESNNDLSPSAADIVFEVLLPSMPLSPRNESTRIDAALAVKGWSIKAASNAFIRAVCAMCGIFFAVCLRLGTPPERGRAFDCGSRVALAVTTELRTGQGLWALA